MLFYRDEWRSMIKIKNNIIIEITNRCNMNCVHCYKKMNINNKDMDINVLIRFLTELADKNICPSIVITGGETLLHNGLQHLLEYLNGKYSIKLNTNGILLSNYIDELKKIKRLKVQISLDGYDQYTYKLIRGNNDFYTVIKNAMKAKNVGIDVVFRATLTKYTIDNYEMFFKISEDVDIPIIIKPIINTGRYEQKKLLIEDSQLLQWLEKADWTNKVDAINTRTSTKFNSCAFMRSDNNYISSLYIDYCGKIYPCQLIAFPEYCIGNIYDYNFENLDYNFEEVKKMLIKIIESNECKKCGKKNRIGDGTCFVACFFDKEICSNFKRGLGEIC